MQIIYNNFKNLSDRYKSIELFFNNPIEYGNDTKTVSSVAGSRTLCDILVCVWNGIYDKLLSGNCINITTTKEKISDDYNTVFEKINGDDDMCIFGKNKHLFFLTQNDKNHKNKYVIDLFDKDTCCFPDVFDNIIFLIPKNCIVPTCPYNQKIGEICYVGNYGVPQISYTFGIKIKDISRCAIIKIIN